MTEFQLAKLHEKIAVKDDIKMAVIYSVRNWLAHRMQQPGDTLYLERAYTGAMAAHRRNEPNVRLFSMAIFMAIESGHRDTAGDMLDKAMEYRSFLKANEPFYYGVFCFLRAYLSLKEQRARAAKKHRKAFMSYIAGMGSSPYYDVMQGQLHLAAEEYTQAYDVLARAYDQGNRSVYLHESLYHCYQFMGMQAEGPELLPVLVHTAARGANISRVAAAHEDALYDAVIQDPAAGERLYALSGYAPLLKAVCTGRMENGDMGPAANKLYREAVEKQIDLRGLTTFLIQSSYVNRAENVNRYALERFLQNNQMEPQLAVYVYHQVLTNPALHDLIQGQEDMIMQTAARCLEGEAGGITAREANTLYQFYWSRCKAKGVTGKLAEQAESALMPALTRFEITASPGTRYVYISQPEKRGLEEYELTDGSTLVIDATNENFSYKCLGPGRRSVVDTPLSIRRMVPLADPELYRHFFDKGDRRFHVVAYLASICLQNEKSDIKAMPIFEAMLEESTITKPYRTKILAALGHLYHNAGSHIKALECYAEIDINTLDPANIRQIMEAYLQSKEYDRVAELIAQTYKSIPAPALYEGLCQLLAPYEDGPSTQKKKDNMKALAQAAYNLLLAGYNSETLLNLTITHHKAGQSEWKALSGALQTPDPRIDAQILSGDLWMSRCDIHTQKAFQRLYTAKKAPKECAQFIEFCKYAILTQNLVPEYETINILEKIYLSGNTDHNDTVSDNNFLLLALCHIYLRHNITTLRSDKIIQQSIPAQKAADILLPVFKESKLHPHPYVEKYQPFLYHGQPGKDIRLNYRVNDGDFRQLPMQYLRYGLFTAKLPIFYNETITYYYSDEMPTGSIATRQSTHKNTTPYIHNNHPDAYFAINNAIIYEQMFRHEQVEKIADKLVADTVEVHGQLM